MASEDSAIELLCIGVPTDKMEALAKVIRTRGTAVHTSYAASVTYAEAVLEQRDVHVILYHAGHSDQDLDELLKIRGDLGSDAAVVVVGGDPLLLTKPGVRDWLANENDARGASVIMREQNDLTNRRQLMMARHRLQETEHRCDALMESSKEAISYVHEGMHVKANPVYLELFNVPDADYMEGLPLMDLVNKSSRQDLKRALNTTNFGTNGALFLDADCQTLEGEGFSARLEFTPATIDGEPCVQIIVRRDMGVDSEELERLQKLANSDPQTGLYHRNRFLERLDAMIPHLYDDNNKQYALYYLVLDRFLEIRNSCGLDCAESVLKEAASLIKKQMGKSALVGRFGDATFTIVQLVDSTEEALTIGERLRSAIQNHTFPSAERLVTPSVSIGIARSKQGRVGSSQEFVDRAFKASQVAKSAGGNKVSEYDPGDDDAANPSDDTNAALELVEFAISHDRFTLMYQPMLAIVDPNHENYQVLLYLQDVDDKKVSAKALVPVAQQAGRLAEVDRWVVASSLDLLKNRSPSGKPYRFHYSLSAGALKDSQFAGWLRSEFSASAVNADQITFVLHNDDVRQHVQAARSLCAALKELGCRIMLDGLGTSPQEDLALIKHLPAVSGARLAPELAKDLETNDAVFPKLREANERIQNLGLETVVTEVEHAGALAQAWAAGISYLQGDFLSPPNEKLNFDFSQY